MRNVAHALANGVRDLHNQHFLVTNFLRGSSSAKFSVKAPATDLRRHAQAALEELPLHLRPAALQTFAASNQLNTSERDLLRLLKRVGLMEDLAVHTLTQGAIKVRHIRLLTWFQYLMNVRSGGQLLGGFRPEDPFSRTCLLSFWNAFRLEKPDHAVFQIHGHRLQRVIPFAVHLDEGRGLRKSAVLVVHLQSIFGADTAQNFRQDLAINSSDHLSHEEVMNIMLRNQFHNGRGNTYESRMLYTILPKASYTKRNAPVFTAVLDQLRRECTDLFENGFWMGDGTRFFVAMIAVKGDAPALAKAGNFTRNFQCLPNPICWECMAGSPGVPFEDCRANALYEATLYAERPWDVPGPLSMIPGVPEKPEVVYQRDPFHVYKQSVGGSYAASSIVLVAEMGYWDADQNTFADVMERAYADFDYFVKHDWTGPGVPFMKHFTRTNLHYPRTTAFPYARPKGGDVMLLTRWLRFLMNNGPYMDGARHGSMIRHPLQAWHVPLLRGIEKAAGGVLKFFRLMHNNGLWLTRQQATDMGQGAFEFCAAYAELAQECHNHGLTRYSLVPSLHYFHHFFVDMKQKLSNAEAVYISSPSIANCEADEDYIGKIARISRHVHPGVTNQRTIDRYLVQLHFVYSGEAR